MNVVFIGDTRYIVVEELDWTPETGVPTLVLRDDGGELHNAVKVDGYWVLWRDGRPQVEEEEKSCK